MYKGSEKRDPEKVVTGDGFLFFKEREKQDRVQVGEMITYDDGGVEPPDFFVDTDLYPGYRLQEREKDMEEAMVKSLEQLLSPGKPEPGHEIKRKEENKEPEKEEAPE